VCVCVCVTLCLSLMEKRWLRVFENELLNRLFGSKKDEVAAEWIGLHYEETYDLYFSPSIMRMIKFRSMR